MTEEVTGQPASSGESPQAAILDVLIRGLQNAKDRSEAAAQDADGLMKTCILWYSE